MVTWPVIALAAMYGVVSGAANYFVAQDFGLGAAVIALWPIFLGGTWLGRNLA